MAMLNNQMVTFEAVGGDMFFVFLPSLPGLTHADPYQSRQGIIPKLGHPGEFPKRWCGWFH